MSAHTNQANQRAHSKVGIWTPGVQLFRRIKFRNKALLISGCFLIPPVTMLLQLQAQGVLSGANLTAALMVSSLSILLAGYFFYSFFLTMDKGLHAVRSHLLSMTEGDLTRPLSAKGSDEIASIMRVIESLQTSIRDVVAQMRANAEEIVYSSSEVASGAMDLSDRTEQTAANLEKSASSMEEISSTVQSTADHAAEAAGIAQHNAVVAAKGGEVMQSMHRHHGRHSAGIEKDRRNHWCD